MKLIFTTVHHILLGFEYFLEPNQIVCHFKYILKWNGEHLSKVFLGLMLVKCNPANSSFAITYFMLIRSKFERRNESTEMLKMRVPN